MMRFLSSLLEIRDLRTSLGGRPVLRGVSLKVEEGETVALLGRSGSGKTTLLKCVNGLLPADSGEVRFEGRSLAEWDIIQLRRRMGYVLQDAGLFPHWTVARNIGLVPRLENWPPERTEARTRELLSMVGLPPDEYVGRYPRELSGGQRQRAGIARALAADPPLLLLDEPFAALDPITRLDLQRQFVAMRRTVRKTALFVTHDVREALLVANRIALLRDGVIDTLASPAEFIQGQTEESRAFLECLADSPKDLA
jgi:osmoprotectant transport system ATP-binding protein